jgi:hypothetical protein
MRRMIIRMIATGSLSAFSSAAIPELPSQSARGIGGPAGVQQARAGATQAPTQAAPQPAQDQPRIAPPTTTGRTPPRGSLLDLSV